MAKYFPMTNVRDWGAIGDGATDDLAAINEAIEVVAQGGGGIIFFPPGTYLIDGSVALGDGSDVHPSIHLMGAGSGASVIEQDPGAASPIVEMEGLSGTPMADISISDLALDGSGIAPSAISGAWLERVTLRDLHLHDVAGSGIDIRTGGHDLVTISHCLIEDVDGAGIELGSDPDEQNRNCRVDSVTVRRFDKGDAAAAGIDLRGPGILVSNCIVEEFPRETPSARRSGVRCRSGERDTSESGEGANRAQIVNCHVTAAHDPAAASDEATGFEVAARDVLLTNCTARFCHTGFLVTQENAQLANCQAIDAYVYGFHVKAGAVDFDSPTNGRGAVLTGCSSVVEERVLGVATGGTTGRVDLQANMSGTAGGVDPGEITLAGSASGVDDFYVGRVVEITAATTGAGQRRTITAYDGTSKVATVSADWAPEPTGTIGYKVWFRSETDDYYNGRYVEMLWGGAAGQMKRVTSYDGATGQASTGTFAAAPSSGDGYQIVANPDGFVIETNDCVLTGCRVIGPAVESTDNQTYGAEFAAQTTHSGALAAASAGSATLDAGAAAVNGAYVGQLLEITSGAGTGQTRKIVGYLGSARTATITPDWDTTPAATDTYTIASLDGNVWTAGRMTGISRLADHLNGEADAGQIHEYLSVRPLHALGTTTAYTLALTDAGKLLESNRTGGTVAITIPPEDDVLFPAGTLLRVANQGTATVTLTPATGVTLISAGSLTDITQGGIAELYKRSPTTWYATGDLT